ncbi:MAG: hypothetical protein JF600_05525 [Xanthomonadales bacterium]|nr:hypothetical protein [Xanthomonadales bacterium]
MSVASRRAFPVLLSLFAAGAAWAGPKEDMKAMSAKFLAQRSYHVRMESSDKRAGVTEMDFVAPDRYRMQMAQGTQYIIGDTMYMNVSGHSMKVPMPKGSMTQWRQNDLVFREVDRMQVQALGADVADGRPARKYRMTAAGKAATSTLIWVGANDLPIKLETTGTYAGRTITTTIHYSRFNDPAIRVDPPK